MGVDVDRYLKAADEAEKRRPRGARDWWAAEEGRNQVRVVSDPATLEVGMRDGGVHFIERRPYFCPRLTIQQPCPVCEYVDELYKSGTEEDIKLAKSLSGQSRYYYNIIDRKDVGKGVQVFGAPPTVQDQIRDCFREYGDITDPKEGHDIIITKHKDKVPALMYRVQVDPRGASKVAVTGWEEQLYDLEAYVQPMAYEELGKVLQGEAEPEPEAQTRRGPPASSPAGRRTAAPSPPASSPPVRRGAMPSAAEDVVGQQYFEQPPEREEAAAPPPPRRGPARRQPTPPPARRRGR